MRILFLGHTPRNPAAGGGNQRVQNLLRSYASPGTTIDFDGPDDYEGAHVTRTMSEQTVLTGLNHAMATGALIRKAVWAEENGYDAVIQSNTFDPGIEASRFAVRIPVIGVMRCTLHTATTLCDRIAVTVPLPG